MLDVRRQHSTSVDKSALRNCFYITFKNGRKAENNLCIKLFLDYFVIKLNLLYIIINILLISL